MTTLDMSAGKVMEAIDVMAGIKLASPQLPLISGRSAQIKTAILSDDAEGLAAHVCNAVATELKKAGFDGVISVRGLRAHINAEGWKLIEDVVQGRENAAAIFKRKMEALASGSQFGPQGTRKPDDERPKQEPQRPSQPPVSSAENRPSTRQDDRHAPQRHSQSSASSAENRPPSRQDDRQAPRPHEPSVQQREHDQRSQRPQQHRPVPSDNASASRPPQRHQNDNVRTIGSARRPGAQGAGQGGAGEKRVYDQKKVHGGKAALNLEADITRRDEPTIRVEAAKMLNQAERTYDWAKKVAIQMTPAELQHVTALLYGLIPKLRYSSHGPAQDKWFEIERQTGNYAGTIKFVVGQGNATDGIMCITSISSADLGDVVALFTRQCSAQMKLEQGALLMALRPLAEAYNSAAEAKASRGNGNGGGGGYGSGSQPRTQGGGSGYGGGQRRTA